jgi:hypothetical protein
MKNRWKRKMEDGVWLEGSAPQQSSPCHKFRKTDHGLILKQSAQ